MRETTAQDCRCADPASPECNLPRIGNALRFVLELGVPGVAATVKSPHCGLWTGGAGVADLETGRKARGDEHGRIGSDTKTWTATVVLQLVGEGKVKLEDTVDHYLPGLVRTKDYDGRKITVRQLLQHTSGLPDYLDAPFWEDEEAHRWDHIEPLQTVQQALRLPPPDDRARSGFAYSNTNYNLAGLIVQKVTGHDIGTEITRRIIQPLGLRETYWPGDSVTIRDPHLRCHKKSPDGVLSDTTDWNTSEADASGVLISTAADATAFWIALLTGKLLAPAQLAEMKATVPADDDEQYGLGVIRQPPAAGGTVTWGHSGSMASGHGFLNSITADGERAVTLLINTDDYDRRRTQALVDALVDELH
ncbi:serine hydrolase domain-containing protein [Actinomadura yumaensis]|uniref:Serine hydrolase domain-containing protein n=1 Tax=Actinomadura yumaensis TaxID=111807 RepID=A0ABW2CI18_9ACTN